MTQKTTMGVKILLLATYTALFGAVISQSVDLTLVPEAKGTAVVEACIAKLTGSNIFPNDNQLLRRIAFAETQDGNDADTYRTNYHGGIWQLSETRFQQTKDTMAHSQLQAPVNNIISSFGITWSSTQWVDLRKPLYSALAARLYFYLISTNIPLAADLSGQASYWVDEYTSNGGTTTEFVNSVLQLQALEGEHMTLILTSSNFFHRLQCKWAGPLLRSR